MGLASRSGAAVLRRGHQDIDVIEEFRVDQPRRWSGRRPLVWWAFEASAVGAIASDDEAQFEVHGDACITVSCASRSSTCEDSNRQRTLVRASKWRVGWGGHVVR